MSRYAVHARTFFPQRFVSIENKGLKIQLPKLKVARSSLVARSSFPQQKFQTGFSMLEEFQKCSPNVPQI